MDIKKELEDFYSIFPWDDDPESASGKEYLVFSERMMEIFLSRPYMDRFKKGRVKILEICAGSGFGGVALSKKLMETGADVKLLMTDLREDALKRGKDLARKNGIDADYMVIDARKIRKIKGKYDIILFWGLPSPHFSPQEIVKLFSSIPVIMKRTGVFLMDEADRRESIFLRSGYKDVLGEERGGKFVMSFHTGYDPYTGMFRRRFFSPDGRTAMEEIYMWSVAETSTLLSLFFKDVEIIHPSERYHYLILAKRPLNKVLPEDIKPPVVVKDPMECPY